MMYKKPFKWIIIIGLIVFSTVFSYVSYAFYRSLPERVSYQDISLEHPILVDWVSSDTRIIFKANQEEMYTVIYSNVYFIQRDHSHHERERTYAYIKNINIETHYQKYLDVYITETEVFDETSSDALYLSTDAQTIYVYFVLSITKDVYDLWKEENMMNEHKNRIDFEIGFKIEFV